MIDTFVLLECNNGQWVTIFFIILGEGRSPIFIFINNSIRFGGRSAPSFDHNFKKMTAYAVIGLVWVKLQLLNQKVQVFFAKLREQLSLRVFV